MGQLCLPACQETGLQRGWELRGRAPAMIQGSFLPPHAFLPCPHGYHTCEAYGALESATHALEAVFNEVAEELSRGVKHLVAQLTLMVNALLCKEK